MGAAPTCRPTPACCMPVPRVSGYSLQATCMLLVLTFHPGWKPPVSEFGLAVCWHTATAHSVDWGWRRQPSQLAANILWTWPGSATCSLLLITVHPCPVVHAPRRPQLSPLHDFQCRCVLPAGHRHPESICTGSAACSPGLRPLHDTLQVHAPSWLQTYWNACASSGASPTCQPTPT